MAAAYSWAKRMDALLYGAIAFAFVAGFVAAFGYRAHTYTVTRIHRQSIQDQYGKPDSVVDGAQVNSSFAGLRCAVYAAKRTVICAP